jgi:hypothetical protein
MKNLFSDQDVASRVLALVRLDAQRLYERIKFRAPEYMTIFSSKRTRDHFAAIFKNRYDEISIADLKYCTPEVIEALDLFYTAVDNLRWYLYTTEDMPSKVDTEVHRTLKELKNDYDQLVEVINQQHGTKSSPAASSVDDDVNQIVFDESQKEQLDIAGEKVSSPEGDDFTLKFDFSNPQEVAIDKGKPPLPTHDGITLDLEEDVGTLEEESEAESTSTHNFEIKLDE